MKILIISDGKYGDRAIKVVQKKFPSADFLIIPKFQLDGKFFAIFCSIIYSFKRKNVDFTDYFIIFNSIFSSIEFYSFYLKTINAHFSFIS